MRMHIIAERTEAGCLLQTGIARMVYVPLVFVICAYQCGPPAGTPERGTWSVMSNVSLAIEYYRESEGSLPSSLSDVCLARAGCRVLPSTDLIVDGWGRALSYEAGGVDYELRSSGPDGEMLTADDIVFDTRLHAKLVKRATGCYQVDLQWLRRDAQRHLVLDSTLVGNYWFIRDLVAVSRGTRL